MMMTILLQATQLSSKHNHKVHNIMDIGCGYEVKYEEIKRHAKLSQVVPRLNINGCYDMANDSK